MKSFIKSKKVVTALAVLLILCLLPVAPCAAGLSFGGQADKTTEISMQYDDRYSFAKLFPDMHIVDISDENVTSYKVASGAITGNKDDNVIKLNGKSQTEVIACGVGEATVILADKSNADAVRAALKDEASTASLEKLGAIKVTVKVAPAVLTMMFLFGQSNAEGNCSENLGYHPENSVACINGTVYSTYAPRSTTNATNITGINSFKACSVSNYKEFVAGSLTGKTSLAGKQLVYPINSLTSSGNGKTGPDSGLAYEWNRLSGDKVWVVNAAYGGSSIVKWIQSGSLYERALYISNAALKTAAAEIAAGHYTAGKRLVFWLQGESDKNMSEYEYQAFFDDMIKGFKSELKYDKLGIISVRAASVAHRGAEEKYMTGPRLAQYYYASSTAFRDVYIVSNANEKWITDNGVFNYFNSKYPSGKLAYSLRKRASALTIPKTVAEINTDIHFSQIAHNENGITAANTMYYVFNRPKNAVSAVAFLNAKGVSITNAQIKVEQRFTAVPVVYPLYCSKDYIYTTGRKCAYTCGTIIGQYTGKDALTLTSPAGKAFSLNVNISLLNTPVITLSNNSYGVRVTWNKINYATKYTVVRKNGDNSWAIVGKTGGTAFTDQSVKSNNIYTYKVICISSDGLSAASAYSSEKSIKYIAAPTISSLKNVSSGVAINWAKSAGAVNYRVFRREGNSSSWKRLTDTTAVSYTDKTVKSGVNYYYCIRCISKDGNTYISGAGLEKNILALKCGEITKLSNTANGISVSWKKVTGAKGYLVYRKPQNGSYKKIATISSGNTLSFTDTAVKSADGTTYYYAVKAYNGKASGAYTPKKAVRLLAPKNVTVTKAGISAATVKWKKVSGATEYQILLKTGNTSKTLVLSGENATTLYLSGLSKNTDYKVYVRYCKAVSGAKYYSAWSSPNTFKL